MLHFADQDRLGFGSYHYVGLPGSNQLCRSAATKEQLQMLRLPHVIENDQTITTIGEQLTAAWWQLPRWC